MKKIPYGISNYEKVKTQNYYLVDKTKYIEVLENQGSPYLFFLRPRRFGKSLFVSMLEHYYDILRADSFESLFGGTYIGANPSPLKNSYPVLKFNFSMVRIDGGITDVKKSFCLHVKKQLELFLQKYQDKYGLNIDVIEDIEKLDDASDMLQVFSKEISAKKISLYLIIDEYDNFANNVLIEHKAQTYQELTHSGGFLRNFFTIIKGLTDNQEIDRLFITGVSPLVMADVTSGFNIGDNISLSTPFESMVGFTSTDVNKLLEYYRGHDLFDEPIDDTLKDFELWYNGYSFGQKATSVFNTVSVLYYVEQYIKEQEKPYTLIDENLRTDYGKLRFLIVESDKLNGNFNILKQIAEENEITSSLVRSFSQYQLIDSEKFISLLFYLGFISIKEVSITNDFTFTIPNKLIRVLMWEYVQKAFNEVLDLKIDNHFLKRAFDNMSKTGNWKPVFTCITDKFYEAVSVRDFTFHEEGFKTFMLAWLNLTNLYDVTSEKEMNKGYADIFLEPDRRFTQYIKYNYIVELKYIKASDCDSSEKENKATVIALEAAKKQLGQYAVSQSHSTVKIVIIVSPQKVLYMDEV